MDSSTNRFLDIPLRVRRAELFAGWICTTTFALANFLGSLIRASASAVRVKVVGTIVVLSIGRSRHGSWITNTMPGIATKIKQARLADVE